MRDGFAPMRDDADDALRERAERMRLEREGGAGGAAGFGFSLPGRLRGREDDGCVFCCGGLLVGFFLLFNMTLSSLDPNEFGLLKNSLSGTVYDQVNRGGLHYVGITSAYVRFPATQVTLEFSSHRGADRLPIQARTGEDHSNGNSGSDQEGGGQPISISCAFQFEVFPDQIRQIYLSFGSYAAAKARWLLLSGNMVSNVAQGFTPQEFWTDRPRIAAAMLTAVNRTLVESGHAQAMNFQILKIDFAPRFEDSITSVQVAEQQRVVNQYLQQVQEVVQTISVLQAQNNAIIANISASADAESREIMASARRDAFNLKQNMKARKYAELQQELELAGPDMAEYFKIKSLQAQGSRGKLVVGMPSVGAVPAPERPEL